MNPDPDATLLRRYTVDGDDTAFAELVRRHLGLVYYAALRQTDGDAHAAEDVAQTVFTLVAQKARTLVHHQTLTGWLHTTTRFAARRHRRTEGRRLRREQEAQLMQETVATDTMSADWEHLRPLIDDVLAELNAADRDAVLLRFFSGLSLAEVGAKLNVSENAARMRVERALEKLHGLLSRRGIASSATALGATLTHQAMATAPAGLLASVTAAALSGAAGVAGSAALVAGLFAMKTSTVILGAIALVAAGTAVFEFTTARQMEKTLAAAGRERAALHSQLLAAQAQTAQAERDLSTLRRARPTDQAAPGGARAAASTAEQPPKGPVAKFQKRSADRAQMLETHYRALYRRLGFTTEQSARFHALALDNIRLNEELLKTASEQDPQLSPSMQRLIDDRARAELLARVRETFGEATARATVHYEDTFPLRGPVEELARNLFYSDTPLTAGQAEQLIDAAANSVRTPQGKINLEPLVQADFYRAMLAQSQGILSPPQVDTLRRVLAQNSPSGPPSEKKSAANIAAPTAAGAATRP